MIPSTSISCARFRLSASADVYWLMPKRDPLLRQHGIHTVTGELTSGLLEGELRGSAVGARRERIMKHRRSSRSTAVRSWKISRPAAERSCGVKNRLRRTRRHPLFRSGILEQRWHQRAPARIIPIMKTLCSCQDAAFAVAVLDEGGLASCRRSNAQAPSLPSESARRSEHPSNSRDSPRRSLIRCQC